MSHFLLSLFHLYVSYNFERGKHMLWNSTAGLFYLFISSPLTGKASGNTSFTHIHTERTLYLSDGTGRILHSSLLLKFPSDHLIKCAVHTTVCYSLKSSWFKNLFVTELLPEAFTLFCLLTLGSERCSSSPRNNLVQNSCTPKSLWMATGLQEKGGAGISLWPPGTCVCSWSTSRKPPTLCVSPFPFVINVLPCMN